jgi:hypothetical protein
VIDKSIVMLQSKLYARLSYATLYL